MKLRTDLHSGNFITKATDLTCLGMHNVAKFVNEAGRQMSEWGNIVAERTSQAYQRIKSDLYPG